VSNRMREAAAAGIQTVQQALKAKLLGEDADIIRNLRDQANRTEAGDFVGNNPSAWYDVRQSDGRVERMTQQQLNTMRANEMRKKADALAAQKDQREQKASASALGNIEKYVDASAVATFQTEQKAQLKLRDQRMDTLFDDLRPWLDAKDPWMPVFERYSSERHNSETGIRCAGQLYLILMHVDNSPKGRVYLHARDVLQPQSHLLYWRMIVLNRPKITNEITKALNAVSHPLPSVLDAQSDGQAAQASADMLRALFILDNTLTSLEKSSKLKQRSISSLIASIAASQVSLWPTTELEKRLANAQLLTIVHGMGRDAITYVQEAGHLVKGSVEKRIKAQQKLIDKAAQTVTTEAGRLRFLGAIALVNGLTIIPAIQRAGSRNDDRSRAEASRCVLEFVGALKDFRCETYKKLLYKELPEVVGANYKTGMGKAAADKLVELKMNAAYWTCAGTAIGVFLDAVDATQAGKYGDEQLMWAYLARTSLGIGIIGSTIATSKVAKPGALLIRIHIGLIIGYVILSIMIADIKGKVWEQWLQRQPFRKTDSHKVPYLTERDLLLDLGEAVQEITSE
jgi:hypothetical protein